MQQLTTFLFNTSIALTLMLAGFAIVMAAGRHLARRRGR
jgi:hypothetical protein